MAKAEDKACRGYHQSLSPGSMLVPRNLVRKVEPQFYYLIICLVASFSAACIHVVCIVARSSAVCMHVEVRKLLLKRIVISTVKQLMIRMVQIYSQFIKWKLTNRVLCLIGQSFLKCIGITFLCIMEIYEK